MRSGTRDRSMDVVVPKEGAFAFLSKSLLEAQRSAEPDLTIIKARMKKFKQLTSGFDDLGNISFPGPGGQDVSPAKILQSIRDTSEKAFANPPAIDDFDFFKNFKQQGLQTWSQKGKSSLQRGRPESKLVSSDHFWPFLQPRESTGKALIRLDDWTLVHAGKNWQIVREEWEPLRKVKEGLKELETSAAASKTPKEFLQKVSRNMKLDPSLRRQSHHQSLTDNVAPLDVPELLESLVRQSEPLLDQLGVKKEVSAKMVSIIRNYRRRTSGGAERLAPPGMATVGSGGPMATPPAEEVDQVASLDARISSVQQSTGYRYKGGMFGEKVEGITDRKRNIAIFTTASLPWMTGTAVNPLLRAAYLAKTGEQDVTLLVPWLSKTDQEKVYPNQITFDTPAEQEQYVRDWLQTRIGFSADFKIAFYPGVFCSEKRSILAIGDISTLVPDKEADVAVLEEPEHLTWYYHGRRWTDKFKDVVGIVHTNYLEYVRREQNGAVQAFLLEHVNNWMVRCYCHKVVRLSAATQKLPRSIVCNVHGVGIKFLDIGSKMAAAQKTGKSPFSKGAYYLGKMIWSKGYRELIDLLDLHRDVLGNLKVDVYGTGEDSEAVRSAAAAKGLRIKFHKGRDHADESIQQYKVFINPSMSDVVCTTTAEALAMGKIVVCADHPSNDFFRGFPNCLTYRTNEEFEERVREAMAMEPVPLTAEHRHLLSWEAATDRFLMCAGLDKNCKDTKEDNRESVSEPQSPSALRQQRSRLRTLSLSMSMPDLNAVVDKGLFYAHYVLSGLEPARRGAGAPPKSIYCDPEMRQELGLPPSHVERTVYGW